MDLVRSAAPAVENQRIEMKQNHPHADHPLWGVVHAVLHFYRSKQTERFLKNTPKNITAGGFVDSTSKRIFSLALSSHIHCSSGDTRRLKNDPTRHFIYFMRSLLSVEEMIIQSRLRDTSVKTTVYDTGTKSARKIVSRCLL